MILASLAMGIAYLFVNDSMAIKDKEPGTVYYTTTADPRNETALSSRSMPYSVQIKPLSEKAFQGIVKQQYDYSCGSAALTTLLNGLQGTKLTEKEVLDGMVKFGETDKIIARRSFSLLDMKRYVNALGFDSGGFKASIDDIIQVGHAVIVPIDYAGSKHFVVVKAIVDGRVFVADPSAGNISFTVDRFKAVWDNNTLFKVTPSMTTGGSGTNALAMSDDDLRHVDDSLLRDEYAAELKVNVRNDLEQMRDRFSTIQRIKNTNKDSPTYGEYLYRPLRMYENR